MLIGIAGYAQTGKDEFYKAVQAIYPKVRRLSFGDAVKKDCQAFIDSKFPGMIDVINNTEHKKIWRKFLVGWGDCSRSTDKQTWIRRLVRDNLTALNRQDNDFILTDVRYLNEGEWTVYEKNGCLVRLHRDGVGPANDTEAATIAEIDGSDMPRFDLYNDGRDVKAYHAQCLALFREVKGL